MTKYDNLNTRTELEQTIARDLDAALSKRGFHVRHNGDASHPAPHGLADIEAWNNKHHFIIEVTKTTKSSADREFPSISDHLEKSKQDNPKQLCFAMYVSPETHYRMSNAIRDYNIVRESEPDQKILPLNFSNFELLTTKLRDAHKDLFPPKQLVELFSKYSNFIDDERILKLLYEELFPTDNKIKEDVEAKEQAKWAKIEKEVNDDLVRIENKLREHGIALAGDAIRQLIYLVFMKLYEEKKNAEGKGRNYFQPKTFVEFQEAQGEKERKRAIHKLFDQIKNQKEFQETALFTEHDLLAEKLDDDFALQEIIEPLDKYAFYKTKVDGLGAVYEVLALRSSKDVKVGQFFTPIRVVNFMVSLAELDTSDVILDPACGTGRFLIWAMEDMVSKVSGKEADKKKEEVRKKQLFGSDNDSNVAKLAKMNMYIHGDGKGNIFDDDGLLLYKTRAMEKSVDAILTNPPLGEFNYRRRDYDEEFYRKYEVIPRKIIKGKEVVAGNSMKGGALFLSAAYHYLRDVRDASAKPEWRGGKLLIILDEGILNLQEYALVQDFIRKHFYIKAVISLTRDTFTPVSKTQTKTSILYAIKKDDLTAKQVEPIFYGHAERVGMDNRRRVIPNDLEPLLRRYFEFKKHVMEAYDGLQFNMEKFEASGFKGGAIDAS